MKIGRFSFLFILGLLLITSCNSDDDGSNQQDDSINGVWNLKNVSVGLSPLNLDYNVGEVIWTFIEANSTVYYFK